MIGLASLRSPAFRRLWLAQAISLIGDWFTLIALAVVVAQRSHGSGLAISGLLLTQLVPTALVGPWSGVLADRIDRRRLLVASDLIRAGIVSLLIPAVATPAVWPIFALSLAHFTVATVFEPARSALVPRLVAASALVSATTLSSVTWSTMTAVGGLLSGASLALTGVRPAFAIDAATFVASALLIRSIRLPPSKPEAASHGPGFQDGLRYLAAHPRTASVLLVKSFLGLGLADTFLVLYATRVFAVGEGGAVSLGILWACFGLGAVLGPSLLNLVNDGSVRRMRRLIAVGGVCVSLGLFGLGLAPTLGWAAAALLVRGMGGSTDWTYSTVILQKVVPSRLQGRVFALDLALLTLVASVASLTWGYWVDRLGIRPVVTGVAALTLLPLVAWTLSLAPLERRSEE